MSGSGVSVYILMGTCGCGKTTIAQSLANELNCAYIEGDIWHPKANVDKMSAGIPLTDEDRWGWLEAIRNAFMEKVHQIVSEPNNSRPLVIVTCSSLRKAYRDLLRDVPKGLCRVVFVYLKASFQLIESRLKSRSNHFMASNMLQSQWKTLEEPDPRVEDVIIEDISGKTDDIVVDLIEKITKRMKL